MPQLPAPDPLSHLTEILPDGTRIEPGAEDHTTFVDDRWIAERIGMQIATIRSQRFKRRRGLPHWFPLDAVMFGSKPRYRRAEAIAWLRSQPAQNAAE